MIIDGVAYWGNWPFRKLPAHDIEDMLRKMEECGISRALVSSLNAIFYQDCLDGNIELANAAAGTDRLVPFAVINPAYPHWREDFLYCLDVLNMKGVEIFPVYHGYDAALPALQELLELAAERHVPVRLPGRLVDIRGRHRMDAAENLSADMIVQIVKLCPETDFLICSCNTLEAASRLKAVAIQRSGRLLYDFSRLESFSFQPLFKDLLEEVGDEHVFLGTCFPFQYPEVQFVKLHYAGIAKDGLDRICGENLAALLSL